MATSVEQEGKWPLWFGREATRTWRKSTTSKDFFDYFGREFSLPTNWFGKLETSWIHFCKKIAATYKLQISPTFRPIFQIGPRTRRGTSTRTFAFSVFVLTPAPCSLGGRKLAWYMVAPIKHDAILILAREYSRGYSSLSSHSSSHLDHRASLRNVLDEGLTNKLSIDTKLAVIEEEKDVFWPLWSVAMDSSSPRTLPFFQALQLLFWIFWQETASERREFHLRNCSWWKACERVNFFLASLGTSSTASRHGFSRRRPWQQLCHLCIAWPLLDRAPLAFNEPCLNFQNSSVEVICRRWERLLRFFCRPLQVTTASKITCSHWSARGASLGVWREKLQCTRYYTEKDVWWHQMWRRRRRRTTWRTKMVSESHCPDVWIQ